MRLFLFALLWSVGLGAAQATTSLPQSYAQRDDVIEYIDSLVAAYGLDRDWLTRTLNQARYSEQAEKLNTPALTAPWQRNWREYRARNVDEARVRAGVRFWRTHQSALERASARWGVPAQYIVAILGIETHYGRVQGQLRTLDVLATLSFDYTRRAALFRDQLAHYLLWCQETGLTPTTARSSFAAAMGLPQFMPSSARRYAVDFDGDGRIDLTQSATDAIGSVAAFLAAHGWQREEGEAVLLEVRSATALTALADQGITPTRTWGQLAAQDVQLTDGQHLSEHSPALLIELAGTTAEGEAFSVWRLGTRNFAALLQYNRSYFYAASVAELAYVLRQEMFGGRVAP